MVGGEKKVAGGGGGGGTVGQGCGATGKKMVENPFFM